ncbi:MAG: 50S ribosomal protein L32 [Patescibacteria group bacterium]|nr:50S ribosomal protein L32 [Patescibacteria group bacterium]MCL5432073.1 50S ribosomal protein L32 [Patescibacteria group bacterium]
MTPLPKRKLSTRRQGDRRSHFRLKLPGLSLCSNCHKPIISHRACPHCGFYHGRKVR